MIAPSHQRSISVSMYSESVQTGGIFST